MKFTRVSSGQQISLRRQSNRHTNLSIILDVCMLFYRFSIKRKSIQISNPRKSSRCNARHKDPKNKCILTQKQSKITNLVSSRQQIYFRRQSNRHTNLSIQFSSYGFVYCKNRNKYVGRKPTGEFPLCNARHKDIKNKRILPQKQPKITNFITSRQQTYFRRQSNRHTNLSIFYFLAVVV